MRTTLPGRPRDLEEVQAPFVPHFCPNAISGLGYRMAMKGKLVILFDKNIVWSIVRVPSMLELDIFWNWRHVHEHFKPRRDAMTVSQVFWTCTMTIGTIAMGMLQTACKFTEKIAWLVDLVWKRGIFGKFLNGLDGHLITHVNFTKVFFKLKTE